MVVCTGPLRGLSKALGDASSLPRRATFPHPQSPLSLLQSPVGAFPLSFPPLPLKGRPLSGLGSPFRARSPSVLRPGVSLRWRCPAGAVFRAGCVVAPGRGVFFWARFALCRRAWGGRPCRTFGAGRRLGPSLPAPGWFGIGDRADQNVPCVYRTPYVNLWQTLPS